MLRKIGIYQPGREINSLGYMQYTTRIKKINYFKKKIPKILSVKNINEFSKVKVDILNICTTPSSHYQNLKYCLKLNKPILIEKPILTNSNEMKKIKKIFQKI